MGAFRTARDIYLAIKDDASAIIDLREERARLAKEIATTDGGSMEITSATVNGQSYAGRRSMTKSLRLRLLTTVIAMIEAEGNISQRTTPIFPGDHGNP